MHKKYLYIPSQNFNDDHTPILIAKVLKHLTIAPAEDYSFINYKT